MAGDSSHVHNSPPPPTTTKKSNKIRDIVRLQQMLKKWKKAATASKNNNDHNVNVNVNVVGPITTNNNNKTSSSTKGLNKFLKKTLSFSDMSEVKKGYLAVWVGRDEDGMKKFVIPTDYLAHEAFSLLLRDAEEEFGFQQEGILKIPCDIPLFEKILATITMSMSDNKKQLKSSSSTSSFFLLYDDQQPDQLNTPAPTTPLYCR
ncbi:hypothetical protein L1987_52103 [Smallanthus sonchifolius]|uniref:Uncharacterized protein n=1 Tax=Smallanthus sonchifolius TaxID=185202 RepID=A0ACB9ETC2_9ASTR|nr:hypothetical protein L1987_52103 [Smallanthus sonchifolius]